MSKKTPRASFADVVEQVASSTTSEPPPAPGLYGDVIVDPRGKVFELIESDVSEERALDVARTGAPVWWDACGCGGRCGDVRRYTAEEVKRMATSGAPAVHKTKRHNGRISEFRAADGSALLLAEMWVSWGGVLG